MSVTISILLDQRRVKQNGKFPLKLRVIFNRLVRDYTTVFELTEVEYNKLSASRVSEEIQNIRRRIQEIKSGANLIIEKLIVFDFQKFENEYVNNNDALFKIKKPKLVLEDQDFRKDHFDYTPFLKRFTIFQEDHSRNNSISITFLSYIKKLLQQGRIGSAINYQRTYRSLYAFNGNVLFSEITVSFLFQYENWMLARGASKTTVGIVLRPLRSIFNEAIEDGIITKAGCYPFGRRKYQIPVSRNLKKALTKEELGQIYFYNPTTEKQRIGKAFWLFCYLANGMNVKDMINLKWKNIQGEYLIFERSKTESSTRINPKPIVVFLTLELWNIINTEGNSNRSPQEFIFPLMRTGLNPLEQFDLLDRVRLLINNTMAQIVNALGIQKRVTTIVTRHSFSTQLKRAGVSTEYIQEALGHSNIKTTENYLDSFPMEMKKEFASKLLSFMNTNPALE